MKKVLAFFVVFMMVVGGVEASGVTMYAPDGRTLLVSEAEVPAYKNVGWYESIEDVTKTMYAPDGRELVIYISEIPAYKNVGWYENIEDVTKTMYAPDGRELVVYISEVPAYKNVGWYESIEEVTQVMCAPDGRKITVYISEVQAYKNVGWYPQQGEIDPTKPMVALTFDDGPRPATTGRILNALELYNVRATFFVVGNIAQNNTQTLTRMQSIGCQIGNHSYSHPDLAKLSQNSASEELKKTSEIINNAVGEYPTAIRAPYGSYSKTVYAVADKPLIFWSIDTLDWKYRRADYVTDKVLSTVRDGDIILMHDIYESTATAAERIIPALILMGYQLVTVDELAMYKGVQMSAHQSYSHFR